MNAHKTRLFNTTIFLALLLGALHLAGGVILLSQGGSPYFIVAGIMVIAVGAFLYKKNAIAYLLFSLFLLFTIIWAIAEAQLQFWQLFARLSLWLLLGMMMSVSAHLPEMHHIRSILLLRLSLCMIIFVGVASAIDTTSDSVSDINHTQHETRNATLLQQTTAGKDWSQWGGNYAGQRYSSLTQITPENIGQLQVAWTYPIKEAKNTILPSEIVHENTPLKVGNTFYVCTPQQQVLALNASTGEKIWQYDIQDDLKRLKTPSDRFQTSCRGISYYDLIKTDNTYVKQTCRERIYVSTNDQRLLALDAHTGELCTDFAVKGTLSLFDTDVNSNIQQHPPSSVHISVSSLPITFGNLVIVSSHTTDTAMQKTAPGVLRAFDVENGRLIWQWSTSDLAKNIAADTDIRAVDDIITDWSVMSADEELCLIYFVINSRSAITTANEAPRYTSTLVAVDMTTGKLKWQNASVHNDLWSANTASQPVLTDFPIPKGVLMAIMTTDNLGNLLVLNRANGQALPSTYRTLLPAMQIPQTSALQESNMWGYTSLDMLFCRIQFASLKNALQSPGAIGTYNMSNLAIDPYQHLVIIQQISIALTEKNLLRDNRQYRVVQPFLTPWHTPCQSPAWGTTKAVDIFSQRTRWQSEHTVMQEANLPVLGSALITANGLVFMSGQLDNVLRVYGTKHNKLLWESHLPGNSQTNPITYQGKDGKQYVVVVTQAADKQHAGTVIAYALSTH